MPTIILGLGQGLNLAPVTSAGIHNASYELTVIASDAINMMH